MPVGAHTLLSFLAEPLKQLSESCDQLEDLDASENLKEFQDWVCVCVFPPSPAPSRIWLLYYMLNLDLLLKHKTYILILLSL